MVQEEPAGREGAWEKHWAVLSVPQACLYTVLFPDFAPQSKQHSCQLITLKIVEKLTLEEKALRKNSYSLPYPAPPRLWLCIREALCAKTWVERWPPVTVPL